MFSDVFGVVVKSVEVTTAVEVTAAVEFCTCKTNNVSIPSGNCDVSCSLCCALCLSLTSEVVTLIAILVVESGVAFLVTETLVTGFVPVLICVGVCCGRSVECYLHQ